MDNISSTSAGAPQRIEPGSIAAQIVDIVIEIIGEDAASFLVFTKESSFINDLEMDSIQVIRLSKRVNELYGDQVDLIGWLSKRPVNELLTLTIGDVSSFVEEGSR
ncbi:MAG: acyl carrier protein [Coriobacteriales bacterium]|jgi:acyl carrier protein|nr:acyl carrier protein [Coriobacteriales bacterium]